MLVSTLVGTAYRIAGIQKEAGRGYSQSQGTEGLAVLNSMLDSMQTERLLVPAIIGKTFDIETGQASYTVGSGGDINIPRPTQLVRAGYIFTSTNPEVEVPLEIWNDQQWDAEETKTLEAQIPYAAYYQRDIGDGTGFGYFYPWPIPLSSGQIVLYVFGNSSLSQVAGLATSVALLQGYQAMIEFNLAVWLALRFPDRAHISPVAERMAITTKRKVQTMNEPALLMQSETGSLGVGQRGGNWNSISGHYNSSSNWVS